MVRVVSGIFVIALFALGACKSQKEVSQPQGQEATTKAEAVMKVAVVNDPITPTDDQLRYDLRPGTLVGDVLTIKVKYGGGCGDHHFELIAHPNEQGAMQLWLIHHAGEDPCKAFVREDLQFDLSPLKKEAESPLLFTLNHEEKQYTYSW